MAKVWNQEYFISMGRKLQDTFVNQKTPFQKKEQCTETSAYKIQKPGNYPEESIQHSEHGESLKSRILHLYGEETARHIRLFKKLRFRRRNSVPKRRHTKFRSRGITQKKAYNIQNMAKVWNQEYFISMGRNLQEILVYSKNSVSEEGTDRLPKRQHIKFRHRGITQKKAYNIQNMAKVWNQGYCVMFTFRYFKAQINIDCGAVSFSVSSASQYMLLAAYD